MAYPRRGALPATLVLVVSVVAAASAAVTSDHPVEFSLLAIISLFSAVIYYYFSVSRPVTQGILFGIGLEIALIAFYQLHMLGVHRLVDIGADVFMGVYRGNVEEKRSIPLVFVDIDDESVVMDGEDSGIDSASNDSWEVEGHVSRSKLRDAIIKIMEVPPTLLIVDIDLSYPQVDKDENIDLLYDIFQNLNSPVILAWMTDPDPGRMKEALCDRMEECRRPGNPELGEEPWGALRFQGKRADSVGPTGGTKAVYWANPTVTADADLVVRRWPRCDSLSDECEDREDLSMAGLAAVISAERNCEGGDPEEKCPNSDLQERLVTGGRSTEFRIVYTLPWEDGEAPPTLADGTPLLTRVSARALTRAKESETALPDEWRERIVVVGGSYGAARDIHQTPIGPMPGAIIMANAIHSLHRFGVVNELSPFWKFAGALFPIIGVGLILGLHHYGYVGLRLATILAFAVTVALALMEAYAVLAIDWLPNIWLDATLPCIGVIVHHWFEDPRPHGKTSNGDGLRNGDHGA